MAEAPTTQRRSGGVLLGTGHCAALSSYSEEEVLQRPRAPRLAFLRSSIHGFFQGLRAVLKKRLRSTKRENGSVITHSRGFPGREGGFRK